MVGESASFAGSSDKAMVGKRVQFDAETWEAIEAAMHACKSFQQIAAEAFADYLKKHKQPLGLMASLKESVSKRSNKKPR
jgi:hypothetical protein